MSTIPVTMQERIPLPGAPIGRPAAHAQGLTATDVLRILRQRIFMILVIWIGASAAAVGVTWYLQRNYPQYTARTAIQIVSPSPKTPMMVVDERITTELMNRYVSDQAVLMKDEVILREALIDAGLRSTGWYKAQKDSIEALRSLKNELGASQITGSSYLSVSFATGSPKDAAVIVNTVVDKYLARVRESSKAEFADELKDYDEQERRLQTALEDIFDQKHRFMQERLGTAGVTQGVNVVGATLLELTAAATRVEQEKLQAKSIYDNLTQSDPSRVTISPEMMRAIRQDPEVASLQYNRSLMQQQLELGLQQLGENNRAVQSIKIQLEMTEKSLRDLMAEKEKEVRDYQINSAYTMFLNATQEEIAIRERISEVEAKQRDLDQGMVDFKGLEDRQEMLQKQLDSIREYINRLQLIIKDRNPIRVKQVGLAQPPDQMSFPQWRLFVPAGSLLGLMLGVGLAMLLELADTSIKTPRDVVRHVHIPILGTVPDLDDEEVSIEKMELAVHQAPRSMISEAFRTVRTNLLLSAPAERQRTLLITSSRPEEGKTAIATNLAISIGQSGRRVLLIDANFHRPALQQVFPNTRREGLSNGLIGQGRIEDLVSPTTLPNLDILASGPIPPNPTELLAGSYMRDLLAQAVERYDQVILDGPPVLLVSDALILAGLVDGVILVCRAKVTSRGIIQRAREQLERVNGRLFGAVLNAAQIRRGGYFREQIRSYYDYRPEELLTAGTKPALPGQSQESPKA